MRLATFNIGSARGPDGRCDLDGLRRAIAGLDVDVLALQEVDRDQRRSERADLTVVAAEAMGAEHRVFAPALYGTPGRRWRAARGTARDGPAYGCALLSRRPMTHVEVVHMPALPVVLPLWVPGPGLVPVREEPRVAITARLRIGDREVTVAATHLPFVPGWKRVQLRRLTERWRDAAAPLLLLGDLNLRAGAAARISGFRALAELPTFPAHRPRLQLDHVLLRGTLPARVVAVRTPVVPVSDHRPLVVDLDEG